MVAGVSAAGQTPSLTRQPPASRNFGRHIVRFKPGTGKPDRAAAASREGASVRFNYDIVDSMAIDAPASALQGLMHNPHVMEILPDRGVFLTGSAPPAGGT